MKDPLLFADLPVAEIVPEVRLKLRQDNVLIVTAPPGAGKSTLLPLTLLGEPWLNGKKIVMLEPRRLAAKAIATRMAQMLGEQPGEKVGYRIRFETRITEKTRLEVVTEGILTRMLQSDNAIEDVGLVIFDEYHERSLHADLALALCRNAQHVLRPDLRILIMSATIDVQGLQRMLAAPAVESKGRIFPVDVRYGQDADATLLPELTARQVVVALQEQEGDVLVFLPGEAEIRKCAELLEGNTRGASIHPLYGMLPFNEQQRAIQPDRNGRRKVVIATSIAETSLTIEGVRLVVDCGFARGSRFDLRSGLSKLETFRVSVDSADQRAGRAGRLGPGVCYRMWSAATQGRLKASRVPEIMEADLSSLMLDLARWGIEDPYSLEWLDPPPKASVAQARELLEELNALAKGKITSHGKLMHALPCHPRLAHMLVMANQSGQGGLSCDIAAVLEERDFLDREAGSDISLRVEALRRARGENRVPRKMQRVVKAAETFRDMLRVQEENAMPDHHDCGLMLAYAYPERIACARPGNNAQFQLSNGRFAMLPHQDSLAHEPWIAVANMDMRETTGKIFLAAALNPRDLAGMLRQVENLSWDSRKGGLQAALETRLGGLVLQSKPLSNPDPEKVVEIIWAAIQKEREQLLEFDEAMQQLQSRIASVRQWRGDQALPASDSLALFTGDGYWLKPYLNGIKRTEDLRKVNLAEALYHALGYEEQQLLDRLAPARVQVPSGSNIKLVYFANGDKPVMEVRLQEVFGLADTPTVNEGRVSVVMKLLSPGYKPVQVTSDLKSFWNNLYFEVRSELKRRYPKHAWPEDPWNARAVAKGRSHK